MKLNFSLHLRYFIIGCIIFIPLVILVYSIPLLYEDTILENILDDFEDWSIFFSLFFIFSAYSTGIISESVFNPFQESSLMADHLVKYCSRSTGKDVIIQHSQQFEVYKQNDPQNGFTNIEVYKYMLAYIISQNDSLNKDVQGHFFKIHIVTALQIACGILFLTFVFQLIPFDYNKYDNFVTCLIQLCILFFIIIVLFRVKWKMRIDLLESIERSYFILTEYPLPEDVSRMKEEKIHFEL